MQIVVLTWGTSQRDLEAVERILGQVRACVHACLPVCVCVVRKGMGGVYSILLYSPQTHIFII